MKRSARAAATKEIQAWLREQQPNSQITQALSQQLEHRLVSAGLPRLSSNQKAYFNLVRELSADLQLNLDVDILRPGIHEPFRVVPDEPEAARLCMLMEQLIDLAKRCRRSELRSLPAESLILLSFFVIGAECAVSAWLILTAIGRTRIGHWNRSRDPKWLWIASSPASSSNLTPVLLLEASEKLVREADRRSRLGTTETDRRSKKNQSPELTAAINQRLLFPRVAAADVHEVTISEAQFQVKDTVLKALQNPTASAAVPGLPELINAIGELVGRTSLSMTRLENAWRFRQYLRGVPPVFIEILFAPSHSSAPDRPFHIFPGMPRMRPPLAASKLEIFEPPSSSEAEEALVEKVRGELMTASRYLGTKAYAFAKQLTDVAKQIRRDDVSAQRWQRTTDKTLRADLEKPPHHRVRIEALLNKLSNPEAPDSLPALHTHRVIVQWLGRKAEDFETRAAFASHCNLAARLLYGVRSPRQQAQWMRGIAQRKDHPTYGDESSRGSSVPAFIIDWELETLVEMLVESEQRMVSPSTHMRARSLLGQFAAHAQSCTNGTALRDVKILTSANYQDFDFQRRTNIPSTKQVASLIARLESLRSFQVSRYTEQGLVRFKIRVDGLNRAYLRLSLLLIGFLGLRPSECTSSMTSHFDWECPEGPRVKVAGTKTPAARRIVSLNRLEGLIAGGLTMVRGDWEAILKANGWQEGDVRLLFGCEMFGEHAQNLRSTLVTLLRKLWNKSGDLYALRHHYATARLIQVIDQYFESQAVLKKLSIDLSNQPEDNQRAYHRMLSEHSTMLVHLLHELGHSSIYSLTNNYFHEMGYLRKRFLSPEAGQQSADA